MEAFLISLSTVAVAEIGDRTQLLALMLSVRYRKPWSIMAGIVCAALLNNAVAAVVGVRVAHLLTPALLDGLVGASLIGMALWALQKEALPAEAEGKTRHGAFSATLMAFFLAELGDKTQIAALTLAAAYANLPQVIAGTTAGLVLANVPIVFIGHAAAQRLPIKAIRVVASALFLILGVVFVVRAVRAAH